MRSEKPAIPNMLGSSERIILLCKKTLSSLLWNKEGGINQIAMCLFHVQNDWFWVIKLTLPICTLQFGKSHQIWKIAHYHHSKHLSSPRAWLLSMHLLGHPLVPTGLHGSSRKHHTCVGAHARTHAQSGTKHSGKFRYKQIISWD